MASALISWDAEHQHFGFVGMSCLYVRFLLSYVGHDQILHVRIVCHSSGAEMEEWVEEVTLTTS
jgi:hypothetical protein